MKNHRTRWAIKSLTLALKTHVCVSVTSRFSIYGNRSSWVLLHRLHSTHSTSVLIQNISITWLINTVKLPFHSQFLTSYTPRTCGLEREKQDVFWRIDATLTDSLPGATYNNRVRSAINMPQGKNYRLTNNSVSNTGSSKSCRIYGFSS